ncbi:MAG: glycogen synthase [Clostridia bacterium]|nr:glycogen synthase [Clostridia bacterium]
MQIMYVASEVVPYAKSGGLADVAGALPKELLKLGNDVSIVMPKYRQIEQELEYVMDFPIQMHQRTENCIIKKHTRKVNEKELTTYFIDSAYYFDRDGMYCHADEAERFAFFDKAVAHLVEILKPDILHLNDWQSGPIAALVKDKMHLENIKILFTIHNLEYNGRFNKGNIYHFGFSEEEFTSEKFEFYGDFSFMKAGILFSDMISTVSKTYAEEIQTKEFGFGYEGLLHMKAEQGKLAGIINGVDYEEYDPTKDKELVKNYDSETVALKGENKRALQEELGLPVRDVPMFAIITRVVHHKGIDILIESLNEILKEDVQLVMLGLGDEHYINRFEYLKEKYEGKVSVNEEFNPALAKRIYASSDIFLMPSVFEPCGLSQLISFRYGTVPITRITGGLKDTVFGYLSDKEKGNGFTFWGNKAGDFTAVIRMALEVYQNKEAWNELRKRDMREDHSWEKSANEYVELYQKM